MAGQEKIYCDFIEQYQYYPKELFELVSSQRSFLAPAVEDENYNLGTMKNGKLTANIAVANAHTFNQDFDNYVKSNPNMPVIEAKSRVVFDFLSQHGVDLTYEKNKDDILFMDNSGNKITREQFYANAVFNDAVSNTNFFDKNIGNIQVLCIQPKSVIDSPRNTEGLSQDVINEFKNIPDKDRLDIIYKRGLYHESIHMAMGTADERKCDVFALLKIMQEHPDNAKTIFDVYNIQRSKMGYTVSALIGKNEEMRKLAIRSGAMTYLMPNTYEQLKRYALNPQLIPQNDKEILKLTCEMTSKPEFSKVQLQAFMELMRKEVITYQDLSNNEIVQACMKQGEFKSIEEYIACDKKLKKSKIMQQVKKTATKSAMKATTAAALKGQATKAATKAKTAAKTAGQATKKTLLALNKAHDNAFDAIMKWGDKHAPQWMNKVEEATVQKAAEKFMKTKSGQAIAKQIEKRIGKEVAVSIAKKIPLICLGVGAMCIYDRLKEGEILKAVGEGASAIAYTVPGPGTLVGMGIDVPMLIDDLKIFEHGVMPHDPNSHMAAESTFVERPEIRQEKLVRKADNRGAEAKKKEESKKKAQQFEANLYQYGGNSGNFFDR